MSKFPVVDVLICGAGAAGLTLAIELARRGVSLRLVDKMDGPFHGSRGKGIQPRTQEIFEDLGIIDRIVASGGLYPPLREYNDDGTYTESDIGENAFSTPAEPYSLPLLVPQFRTEAILRERLVELGHWPEYECELTAFDQANDGIVARIAGPAGEEIIHARYLIGADGGRSFVRTSLGVGFPGKALGVRAVVADVLMTGLERGVWYRFNGNSSTRQLSLCPLPGTQFVQIQTPIPLEGDIDLSATGLTSMMVELTGRDDIGVQFVSWASAYNMSARLAERYRKGRVFLVGDAAHIHPPTGGQGLNASIQDAYNLGWKLAAVIAGAPDGIVDSYEDERRPVAAAMLDLSTKLLGALRQGEFRRGREVHQLEIGYPESSLSMTSPDRSGGPLAGDRAPDAPIRRATGQLARLFELFKGTHWTLIGYDVDRQLVKPRAGLHIHTFGPRGDLIDKGGHFGKAYSLASGEWVLVRPDGHIGAIVTATQLKLLGEYFRLIGLN